MRTADFAAVRSTAGCAGSSADERQYGGTRGAAHRREIRRGVPPMTQPASTTKAPEMQRQFVSFAFFKIDPSIRQLPDQEKRGARSEFLKQFQTPWKGMISLSYSPLGPKADWDVRLLRISPSPDAFQDQQATMIKARLGGYLSIPHSFLAMTKRSMYIDKLDPFHTAESRTHIIPGKRKYLFIYPFVKTDRKSVV